MSVTPISDLARFLTARNNVARVGNELQRLTEEMSSGRKSDLGRALKGDFSGLTSVERGLRMTRAYSDAAALAGGHFGAMQRGLETVQDQIGTLGSELMAVAEPDRSAQILTRAIAAEEALNGSITALNTQVAGRNAFAGTATGGAALISAAEILDALELLVAGAPDATTAIARVDAYFNDPAGGYETTAYLGNTDPQTGFVVAEGETVASDLTALDPALRTAFSGLALAALINRRAGPTDAAALSELATAAGQRMQAGQDALTDLRAELGVAEARIEIALTRHRATETALGIERTRLVTADPFETATELQSVQTQLESLYLLTSRLSRLSLAEYL